MACNWRIRHKLMLGMGLVMAIMGLLLAGTLKGLASYSATMRTIDSKIVELAAVEELRAAIKDLGVADDKIHELPGKVRVAEKSLEDYHGKLRASVERSRDPYQGFKETEQVEALKEGFRKLNSALKQEFSAQVLNGGDNFQPAQATRLAAGELSANSTGLHILIDEDVHDRIRVSQAEKNVIFRIVVSTSVLAVLLMVGLLWIFNRSVAHPIRDLERGVGRVAKGDFDYRIEVHSGDEIEDLAQAFNDMTARLRDMYRDLAQQVNERSRQLIRSERLAGVGFLAAGVAHEINNPLASIAFCGEALERRLADLFESRRTGAGAAGDAQEREIVSKYLKMIQDEAFRCKTITRKLLEFSRGGERRREQTDLGELIQVVLDMVQHLPSAKGKQVAFEPAEKITIWVNGQEIQQVLLNLVVNALESMDEGGQLTISQRRKDNMAEIVFKDTGCGMTSEVLENIFEPFFTRSRTGKGTGLGLSISHRIITQHGGDIEAATGGPNQGSTFTMRLPLEAPAQQQEGDMEILDPEAEFLKLSGARRERAAA
ncbi:MAG TPA: ATP-binding protein [Gemmataceae bacterium]|nr:ATP-binding protein [Gemmataceae bacterium]